MKFIDTPHCFERVHCGTCRDLEDGREWRKSIMKHFEVPGNEIDWDCPYKDEPDVKKRIKQRKKKYRERTGCGCGKKNRKKRIKNGIKRL